MAMEINRNYSSYGAQGIRESGAAGNVKKQETENIVKKAGSGKAETDKSESTTDYAGKLAKLVPSVEFKVGNTFSSAGTGKTLTVNPKLLEKMQNDPEKEKEMKELIKGVETMTKLMSSINAASGWTVVYKHCYIDENGKFSSIAYHRNDFMLNMSDELREERRENEERLLEKTKEKAAEKKEEIEELLQEKREETGKKSAVDEAKQLLLEKASESGDGIIYLDHEDIQTILKAAKDGNRGIEDKKEKPVIGGNLDLQV